jgi:hypothetical protein
MGGGGVLCCVRTAGVFLMGWKFEKPRGLASHCTGHLPPLSLSPTPFNPLPLHPTHPSPAILLRHARIQTLENARSRIQTHGFDLRRGCVCVEGREGREE